MLHLIQIAASHFSHPSSHTHIHTHSSDSYSPKPPQFPISLVPAYEVNNLGSDQRWCRAGEIQGNEI